MEPDTLFVVGLALGVLSIPAVVSSVSRGERPRIATITLMIAGTMLVWAISNKPGGYDSRDGQTRAAGLHLIQVSDVCDVRSL